MTHVMHTPANAHRGHCQGRGVQMTRRIRLKIPASSMKSLRRVGALHRLLRSIVWAGFLNRYNRFAHILPGLDAE